MPEALAITRDDFTAAELREAATHSKDANAARRMLALALVLEGYNRGEAGKLCGMDRQTLRDWVLRYNAEGIAGSATASRPGRSRASRPNKKLLWRRWFAKDLTLPSTAWCAGDEWIWPA